MSDLAPSESSAVAISVPEAEANTTVTGTNSASAPTATPTPTQQTSQGEVSPASQATVVPVEAAPVAANSTLPIAVAVTVSSPSSSSSSSPITYAAGPVPEPVWVEDKTSAVCQSCSKPFTLIFRRHHCRACGRLVCEDCSGSTKWVFADRASGDKPQRVDMECYRALCAANPDVTPPPIVIKTPETPKSKQDKWLKTLEGVRKVSAGLAQGLAAIGPKTKVFCTCDDNPNPHTQEFFWCLTCDPDKLEGVCVNCSKTCHGSHKLHSIKQYKLHSCKCASESKGRKCQIAGGMLEAEFEDLVKQRQSERLEREERERQEYIAKAHADAQEQVRKAKEEAAAMQAAAQARADEAMAEHRRLMEQSYALQATLLANAQAQQQQLQQQQQQSNA